MSDHTKSDSVNANSALSGDFNKGQKLAHELAQLSPAGLEMAKKIEAIAAERIENERRQQQRSHSYRVLKEKVGLLENYIRDQTERPAEIKADPSPDLKIIDEQAEKIVSEKEAFYLRNINKEAEANLWQVVRMERGGQGFSQEMPERELGD